MKKNILAMMLAATMVVTSIQPVAVVQAKESTTEITLAEGADEEAEIVESGSCGENNTTNMEASMEKREDQITQVNVLENVGYDILSSRVDENYSGYYIGTVTQYSDGLNGTLEIDHEIYEMTYECDWSAEIRVWLESDDKTVVCKFENGKIAQIEAVSDVIYPVLTTSITQDAFIYQEGKYIEDEIELKVKIDWKIVESSGYSEDLLKEARGSKSKVNRIQMNINSEHMFFEENGTQFLESDVAVVYGEEKVYSYDVRIDTGYIPEKVNNNIQVDNKLFIETGSEFDGGKSYIRVGNIDLQKERETQISSQTTLNKTVSKMKESINQKTAVALDSTLSYYFNSSQQKEIEQYLSLWLAEVIGTQTFKVEGFSDSLQEDVREVILEKLGVSYNTFFYMNTIHATTAVEGIDKNGERQKIQFTVKISNYTLDEDSTAYASFGDIKYELLGRKNESDNPTSGVGIVTYADLEQFSEQVKNIASDAIKGAYNEVWGKSANKVAAMFVSTPIEKLLAGKFSDNVYTLLTTPTKKYLKKNAIKCPVDVYVYDWDGNLCGSIINNEVSEETDEIFLSVNGDEKLVYMTDGDYVIELVGNDKGEMEVEMEEYADGELQRKIVTSAIPLYKGRKYYEVVPGFYLDRDIAEIVDADNETEIALTEDSAVWNGEISETFAGGDGSEKNPYLISSGAELAKLASDVNNGIMYEGIYFAMTQDIDLNNIEWTPIGYWNADDDYAYFKGNFDGNNYQISNMYIWRSPRMSGLFGEIENSRVCNISLKNAYVRGIFAGGIAGYVEPNCIIENCIFEGEVEATNICGGIAAYVETGSKVYKCTNYGFIESIDNHLSETVGGIAGDLRGVIKECNNYGDLSGADAGGVVGFSNDGFVFQCQNHGNIRAHDALTGNGGGIISRTVGEDILYDCQNYGDISGNNRVGGIVGSLESGIINKCSNLGNVSSDGKIAGGICADAFENTYICNSDNYGSIRGNIAGGILGELYWGTIMNTGNYGIVFVEKNDENSCGGGLVGKIPDGYGDVYSRILNAYSIGEISGDGYIGSIIGNLEKGIIENCYYLENQINDAIGKNVSDFVDVQVIEKNKLKENLNSWVLAQNAPFCSWNEDNTYDGYPCLDKKVLDDELAIKEECKLIIERQQLDEGQQKSDGEDTTQSLTTATVTLSTTNCTYNGKAQKPSVKLVKLGNTILKEGTDYTLSYKNNKNIGTATVIIKGTGSYTGTATATFKISVKKGTTFTAGAYKYKIINASEVAFVGLKNTKTIKVTIPATVKIGGKNFKVTSIANKALSKKTKVTSVTIGSNVKTIGTSAFEGCTKLNKVIVGSGVIKINANAFKSCKKLGTITIKSTKLKTVGKNVFKGIKSTAKIKVSSKKLSAYKKLLKSKGQGKSVKITK